MSTMPELSDEDLRCLDIGRRLRCNPIMLEWRFELPRGGTFEVKLIGRVGAREAAYIRKLCDLVVEVVDEAKAPDPQAAPGEPT